VLQQNSHARVKFGYCCLDHIARADLTAEDD